MSLLQQVNAEDLALLAVALRRGEIPAPSEHDLRNYTMTAETVLP